MSALAKTAGQQRAAWENGPIDSLDKVVAALKFLDMPSTSRKNLTQISTSPERGRFKSAIEECLQINGQQIQKETKRYLFGLVSCISEEMPNFLSQLGFQDIPFEVMLHIGSANGMAFRAAVNAALTKNDPNHLQGVSMVETTLKEACAALELSVPQRAAPAGEQRPHSQPQSRSAEARGPTPVPPRQKEPARAQERSDSDETPMADSGDNDNGYLSTHVYGAKAALCFNAAKSKNKENHTVILDAALSIGERKYDWTKAITIQLGHKELPLLYAVLIGWKNEVKFDAHGAANDKSFEIQRQDGKFFAKVSAKGETLRAVPIGSQDALPIAEVVFQQIMKQVPPVLRNHPDIVLHMMKQTLVIAPV